ncbi:MAG: hypothetical protein GKR89_15225 [Candidatus Latescibacteria bacterium]|nr:hypothetical protein [Candidatus Latescibacterota bacterium]
MRRGLSLGFCGLVWLFLCGPGYGQLPGSFAHPATWGRAAVLGTAAVVDGQGGLYWNPAALARLEQRYRVAFAHADIFDGFDLKHDLVSLVRSNHSWGGGMGLDRLGTSRVLQADSQGNITGYGSYTETRFLLAVAKSFERLQLRRAISPLRLGLGLQLLEVESGGKTRRDLGLDAGWLAVWSLSQSVGVRLGAAVRQAYSSLEGASWGAVLGAALVRPGPGRRPLVAVGYLPRNGRWSVGLDLPLTPGALALGLSAAIDRVEEVGTSWRLGLRLGSGRGQVAYALEDRPYLGRTQSLALTSAWGRYQFPLHLGGWRLLRSGVVAAPARLSAAEEGRLQIDFRYPIPARDLAQKQLQLVLYGPDGQVLEKLGAQELEQTPRGVGLAFEPAQDWLGQQGYLLPGAYTFEVSAGERVRLRGTFVLQYQPEAVAAVVQAYARLGRVPAAELEDGLLQARRLDPSYPHTYYVAGLLAEFSGDFRGAANCYGEAARLSGGRAIDLAGRQIDLTDLQQMDYLDELGQAQKKAGNRLFELLQSPWGPEGEP